MTGIGMTIGIGTMIGTGITDLTILGIGVIIIILITEAIGTDTVGDITTVIGTDTGTAIGAIPTILIILTTAIPGIGLTDTGQAFRILTVIPVQEIITTGTVELKFLILPGQGLIILPPTEIKII